MSDNGKKNVLEPNTASHKRELIGNVVKDKMQKSRVVRVERLVKHSKYEKYVIQTRTFVAHDEKEKSHVGDKVRLRECRPLSKRKRWVIKEVLGQ